MWEAGESSAAEVVARFPRGLWEAAEGARRRLGLARETVAEAEQRRGWEVEEARSVGRQREEEHRIAVTAPCSRSVS
jgi:hypothetical protein